MHTDHMSARLYVAYLRLNIIDQYNFFMGFVDLADQLRNTYRPDHFSRKRKWWNAMFWWAHGVCMTNAYVIYIHTCARDKLRPHEIHSHREFLELVAEGYMFEETVDSKTDSSFPSPQKPKTNRKRKDPPRAAARAAKRERGPNTAPSLTTAICSASNHRHVNLGMHTLIPHANSKVGNSHRCQLCWYDGPLPGAIDHEEKQIRRASQVRCGHCNLWLCLHCWPRWHSSS